MERLANPATSLATLQDFQSRMNGLRDATLLEPSLRLAIEKFTVKQWEEIAADLRHTVSTQLLLLLLLLLLLTTRHEFDFVTERRCITQALCVILPWQHGAAQFAASNQEGRNGDEQQQQQQQQQGE
jgi:hypothetical protein